MKVKKDLIEFQLGGGGYGTFGDDTSTSVYISDATKTEREKQAGRVEPFLRPRHRGPR